MGPHASAADPLARVARPHGRGFAILVSAEESAATRDEVTKRFRTKEIEARHHCYPPTRRQKAFRLWRERCAREPAATVHVSGHALCVHIHAGLRDEDAYSVVDCLATAAGRWLSLSAVPADRPAPQ